MNFHRKKGGDRRRYQSRIGRFAESDPRSVIHPGKVATVSELAQKVKQERAFLFRALSLVNLATDIIEAILNGIRPSPKAMAGQEEPAALTLSKLRKGFPEDWTEHRKLFGME